MSVFAVTEQSRMAAARCGADPEVWCAVHAIHSSPRAIARVSMPGHVSIAGPITGISDKDFTVASAYTIRWSEASRVVAVPEEDADASE